eukprot:scaffold46260_cov24-Tisochrysis_lutea.AAC.2
MLDVLGNPSINALMTMLRWHTTLEGQWWILQALDIAREAWYAPRCRWAFGWAHFFLGAVAN